MKRKEVFRVIVKMFFAVHGEITGLRFMAYNVLKTK